MPISEDLAVSEFSNLNDRLHFLMRRLDPEKSGIFEKLTAKSFVSSSPDDEFAQK